MSTNDTIKGEEGFWVIRNPAGRFFMWVHDNSGPGSSTWVEWVDDPHKAEHFTIYGGNHDPAYYLPGNSGYEQKARIGGWKMVRVAFRWEAILTP